AFTLDPFARAPRGVPRRRYHKWLKTKVDRVVRNILRRVSEADQEIMLRLKRWMRNIDFTELVHEIDRHGGYDFIPVIEPSISRQRATNRGTGGSHAAGQGGSVTNTRTLSA